MMRKFLLIIIGILAVIGGVVAYAVFWQMINGSVQNQSPVACPALAKLCPDGSYVGMSGPNCEFTPCPDIADTIAGKGTLAGTLAIGPICPVEQLNNPCKPTPEMYAARKIYVYKTDQKTLLNTITPDGAGRFSINLTTGNYYIDMTHQSIGNITGVPATIKIVNGKITTLNINIDTGIR